MKTQCVSSRLNWVPQPPQPQAIMLVGRGTRWLAGEGVGGPNSDDWIETLVLCIVSIVYSFTRRTHSVFALVTYY
jgi:hypothetical protein